MRVHAVVLGLVLVAGASSAASQPARDTARVSPVIVSATRTPLAQASLPVAAVVIRGEDLRLRGIATVSDALNDVASAYVAQTGSQGGTTSLFLRGGESKYVKVLIDGVPANDPGGAYDFASLTTDNVDRIEIVRGPVSVVHGADAVTGVVHVITRGGAGPPRTEATVSVGAAPRAAGAGFANGGTASSLTASTTVRGALPSGSYAVAIARHATNGLYRLNNGYGNNAVSGRFDFQPDVSTELRVALRYHDYRFDYPTNSAGDVVDSNAHRVEDRTVLGLELERDVSARLRTVLSLRSSINDGGTDDGPNASGSGFVSQDKLRRRGAEARLQWLAGRAFVVTTGVAHETQDQRSQSQSQSAFGPFYSSFKAARRNNAGYVESLLSPTDALTVTVGVRVDDNERFGAFRTGRLGVSLRPASGTRFRATAGTAYREPTFFESYATGFVTGNPDLKPEQTRSADVGIDQEFLGDRARLSLTAFRQRFRDMIDYTSVAACGFSYCNVAVADADGAEVDLRSRLAAPLVLDLSGTWLRTRIAAPGYDSTASGLYRTGEALIRRPARKWLAALTYRSSAPLSASVRLLSVGTRGDRDFHFPATPVTLDGYQRVDVGAEYAVRRATAHAPAFTLRVENLFDASYQNVYNFLAPRRTTSVGLRAEF